MSRRRQDTATPGEEGGSKRPRRTSSRITQGQQETEAASTPQQQLDANRLGVGSIIDVLFDIGRGKSQFYKGKVTYIGVSEDNIEELVYVINYDDDGQVDHMPESTLLERVDKGDIVIVHLVEFNEDTEDDEDDDSVTEERRRQQLGLSLAEDEEDTGEAGSSVSLFKILFLHNYKILKNLNHYQSLSFS